MLPKPQSGQGIELCFHVSGKWSVLVARLLATPLFWMAGRQWSGIGQATAYLYVPFKGRVGA